MALEIQMNDKLDGMSFCFTGKSYYTRAELHNFVTENGGTVKMNVTKDLMYLVAAEHWTTKAKKAKRLGTQVITENEFLKMIGM
jgi:DNA ligase (NAD+)